MASPESVVIAGSLAQKAGQGGHTWQFLQYILGFKKLGWEVLFVDRLEPSMSLDDAGRAVQVEESVNLRYFLKVMHAFGVQDDFALICEGDRFIGRSKEQVQEFTRRSGFLLNVMGFLDHPAILEQAQRRVFLDTDPGYGQMWRDLGLADIFKGHDAYVTIAENIGQPGCAIPDCGIDWLRWRQPIVLDEWPAAMADASAAFTSIGAWRGPYAPIDYHGRSYGQRAHEFRRFAALPTRSGESFETALDIHPDDSRDIELLESHGWRMVDPRAVTADPWAYRSYIQHSKAELMVARNMYVQSSCGWFSERSICFLASGRPVLAQDTGVSQIYPSGRGLLLFRDLDEAVEGVEAIRGNYARHAAAAREIAETYFDSDIVIGDLIDKLSTTSISGVRA